MATAASQQSALNMFNLMRYIAGLSSNVGISAKKTEYAEAAALVNYLGNTLTHTPTRPPELSDPKYNDLFNKGYEGAGNSNIAYAYAWGDPLPAELNSMIPNGWFADEDKYNYNILGHRRWFLNPFLKTTGFGICTGDAVIIIDGEEIIEHRFQSAVYVQGEPGTNGGDESFYNGWGGMTVPWPAQVMPTEYFRANFPWSLSLDEYVNSASVRLVRRADNRTWNFSDEAADITARLTA